MSRFHIIVGRGALVAGLIVAGAPVWAQTAPASPPAETLAANDPGEIIVTAQKRAENVQSVPLAVSVVSPAQLAAAGVRQFQDLSKIAPSLTIRPAEHPVNANISLRGVGTFAFGIGVEPSVAVLVDEVPLAFQARAFTDLPDVERIEVLRGPQSTLYGKSASAGLINIITRSPTDTLQVRANAVATTDEEYGANFSVSGPINEKLGYVVSAAYSFWDGNVKNLFNGKEVNGRETFNTRGKLRFRPSDDVSFTLSANYLKGATDVGRPFVRLSPNARLRGAAALTTAVTMPGVVIGTDNTDVSNNYNARTNYSGYGGNLRGEIGLGDMTLITVSSYDKFHLNDYLDHDDTSAPGPNGLNIQVGEFRSKLYTQEVRLQSPGDKPFRYTVGAYYAHVAFERPFMRGPTFSLANWFATSKSRQVAGFVQADWEFLPKATLTGGARIQNEKVDYTYQDNLAVAPARNFFSGGAKDTAETWKASLRYEFTPAISAFATYATGYKGQTYDLTTGFNANRAAAGPIKPEKSKDRELGIRTQWFDRRLTVNVTLFDTDYKNLQAQTIETLADGTSNFRLTNVGKLGTKGVEVDTAARVGSDVTLGASVAYLDAKYKSFPVAQCYPMQTAALGCINPGGGAATYQNLTGTRAVQAPRWKFSVNSEYSPALTDNLRGIAQANWQYQSDIFYASRDPELTQKAYHIVNVGLGVRSQDRKWEVVAFVNNVFDQQYFPALVNSAGNFGLSAANPGQATQAVLPRDFRRYGGLRVGLNF
ncbi:TonB-dependent receptor [Sphingomonas sp. BIUV-7]|uniref:TonB-dependent receptor n=1 Tax=Sphingomonas natans TaxID=3063330 RepID=A0ABT8YA42_9SPHN|nr:TonB-dependent receptor [Sphingomonas sp. BIUV-7]MDO6415207.1 TonB-dependent receptor [Sphingomonas sp. BIUV-7]